MVTAYAGKPRDSKFVCLGTLNAAEYAYHAKILAAADDKVMFPGAIYDKQAIQALRFHALAYCHGHTVGGTNPSLVEALGAGSAVILHDNQFNRWVAGDGQFYFVGPAAFSAALDRMETDPAAVQACRRAAAERFAQEFSWPHILGQYEDLLLQYA
jgi:glycosyltransferase involved in cell wall biosynthesis